MYVPKKFEANDRPALYALMRAHPLATLVVQTQSGLQALHVPLHLSESEGGQALLSGHVAKANPVWQTYDAQTPVLAIFHGPQGYISPSWYPSKIETGKVVPTWNYMVAHAYGCMRVVTDAAWLHAQLRRLTDAQEASLPQPWHVDDAPAAYTEALRQAIVGIEIPVDRLIGKFKLSQNQPQANIDGVIEHLQSSPVASDPALAQAIQEATAARA